MIPANAATSKRARVSVIVPVHNKSDFLGAAVDSVLAQTYADWELILVDDASSDGSAALVSELSERHPDRIRSLLLDRNVGPAEARNRAIEISGGGELIALLDADDAYLPAYLERQVGAFDAARADGRRPGIAACNALVRRPGGVEGPFDELYWWSDEISYEQMLERSYILICATFSREAFEEVGGFSGECWGSEDYDLWLRIMERGYEVVTNREPLAVYRDHPAGLSADDLTMADAGIAAYRRALERPLGRERHRLVRARLRHYQALRARALLRRAWRDRDARGIVAAAAKAVPLGVIAFLQSPSRWREWASAKRGAQ